MKVGRATWGRATWARWGAVTLSTLMGVAACGGADGDGDPGGTGAGATAGSGGSTTSGNAGGGGSASFVEGCDGATFRAAAADPAARGPYAVGARTVMLQGLRVEVLYPAPPGSEAGQSPKRYDIRTLLPASEQGKVPDADNPWQDCDCYPELPIDDASGPYPIVLFVHGTAGFRTQSLEQQTHWASHGFVVVSADHPGLFMGDLIGQLCGSPGGSQQLSSDINAMLTALDEPSGELAFLAGHLDRARVAMVGHSAGGGAIADFGDEAQVLVPMAAGGVSPGDALQASLILGAMSDTVSSYSGQVQGYDSSPAPKHLVGINNTGHLAFSSLCELRNGAGEDFVEIATAYGICGIQFASFLFDCDPGYIPAQTAWDITNHATVALFRETLQCGPASSNLASIEANFPEIGEYRSE